MANEIKVPCGGFRVGDGLSCAGGVLSVGDLGSREIKTFETVTDYLNYCVDEDYNLKHCCLGYIKTLEGFSDNLKEVLVPPILCYGLYTYYQYGFISYVRFVDQTGIRGRVNYRYKDIDNIRCETPMACQSLTVGTRLYADISAKRKIYDLKEFQFPHMIMSNTKTVWTLYRIEISNGDYKIFYSCFGGENNYGTMEIDTTSTPDSQGYYYTTTITPPNSD